MKKLYGVTIIFITLFVANLKAQSVSNQTNIWYFNFYCGIDFNSGSPVSLNNGALYTNEGSTSISDSSGNLLFYTDGVTVYNKNHTMMSNGNSLNGGYSSSQSCITMQQPGSATLWYLFTVASDGGSAGAQYSIIDMAAQGGLGEVIVKNVPLVTPVEEKVTACLQSNGIDYWIAFHGQYNNKFYVFPLTGSGVGTVVTSAVGSSCNLYVGCMKFSPDGSKLAEAQYDLFTFQVFDFDNATGELTYGFTIPLGNSFRSYGVEWSRDSRHLFMGNVDYTPGEVYQVDMTLPDTASIIASKTLVGTGATDILGTLQMGPDGKIYVVRYNVFYLGVINHPDSLGAACDYVSNGFSTAPHYNYLGLPNYVTNWLSSDPQQPPSVSIAVSNPEICEKFCVDYYDSSANNPTSWLWEFPGASPPTSTDENPSDICYTVPGVYDVTLTSSNANGSNTVTFPDYITVHPTPPFPVITQVNYTLTSSTAASYQWQLDAVDIPGATNQLYTVLQSGYYTVVINDQNGCKNSATVYVLITAIQDLTGETNISISPNPSNGQFIIELSCADISESSWCNKEISIQVMDMLGQVIYSNEWSGWAPSEKKEIDLNRDAKFRVSTGIYVLEIKNKNASLKKKITVTR